MVSLQKLSDILLFNLLINTCLAYIRLFPTTLNRQSAKTSKRSVIINTMCTVHNDTTPEDISELIINTVASTSLRHGLKSSSSSNTAN